ERNAVHPPSRRVRSWLHAGAHPAPGRSRRATRREELPRAARPPDPLDGRFHRPGLGRARDARAVERREPAGDDLPGDEDRPDLVRPADGGGRDAVRDRGYRLEVPGPARPDPVEVLAEFPEGNSRLILVTGGTGFVGGHVVHELRGRDLPVRCLARDPRKAAKLTGWGCELAEGDVTDAESLHRAVAGADTIVHLVAIRQGPREQFQRIMVDGTCDLLSAARDAGVGRFVHMSALGTSEETREL